MTQSKFLAIIFSILLVSLSSALAATSNANDFCFSQHIDEAIETNKRRKPLYEQLALKVGSKKLARVSKNVSQRLIIGEKF